MSAIDFFINPGMFSSGVPYIARKMMAASTPKMTIEKKDDEWSITMSTLIRTNTIKFKLGEKYEESMPGGVLHVSI